VDPWAPDESSVIRSKRRGRPKRRKVERRVWVWALRVVAGVVALGLVVGGIWWLNRPTGLAALPPQAMDSPGGFRSTINSADTFTVGINLQNTADEPVTLVSARIIAPVGLTNTDLSILPVGPENSGFTLNGDLKPGGSVELRAGEDAVLAARYKVNCQTLLASAQPTDEQIFVTIRVGTEQREEEIVVPVVGDVPWLTATGTRTCIDPVPTGSAEPPDPPDPADGASPDPGQSPAG
jgi:hypothetical protein